MADGNITKDAMYGAVALDVDIDELKGEGDKMVGDDLAEDGIAYLQEINFAEKARRILIAAE